MFLKGELANNVIDFFLFPKLNKIFFFFFFIKKYRKHWVNEN